MTETGLGRHITRLIAFLLSKLDSDCQTFSFPNPFYFRPHSIKSVNARVADVPWISLCRFRSIAGYVTESKSDRRGAAARIRYF